MDANTKISVTKETVVDEDITKVLIYIPLNKFDNTGLSLQDLNEYLTSVTQELSQYRIYNDPKGLVICGRY